MLASQTSLLAGVVEAINSSIGGNSTLTSSGVRIEVVTLTMPDGRQVVLTWDPTAGTPEEGTGATPGDWIVTAAP